MLVAIETHPVQYHAPVYRALQKELGVPTTVVYGSNFSVAGYTDHEFGSTFAWDTDLLSGYRPVFLSRVASGRANSADAVSTRGLADVLRYLHPSAILLLGYSPHFYRAAFFTAWRTGIPLLFRGETTDHARRRSPFKAALRDVALRAIYARCARLLYVGKRSREHFCRLGCPEERLVFAPYCVDTSVFAVTEDPRNVLRSRARADLHIDDGQRIVLFSGKLSSRKGPDLLVQAVRQLSGQARSQITLLFVGDGQLRATLEREVARWPAIDARFLGFRNQSKLSSVYHAADLLALPSRHSETWGLVVNEALHHGLPCVVSDAVGCAPDLISPGVTGEIFASGTVEGLTQALEDAWQLAGRLDIRERCRAQVSHYTVRHAAEGIARAYEATVQ